MLASRDPFRDMIARDRDSGDRLEAKLQLAERRLHRSARPDTRCFITR